MDVVCQEINVIGEVNVSGYINVIVGYIFVGWGKIRMHLSINGLQVFVVSKARTRKFVFWFSL